MFRRRATYNLDHGAKHIRPVRYIVIRDVCQGMDHDSSSLDLQYIQDNLTQHVPQQMPQK